MKATITMDFLIFVAGLIILVVIFSTAFGKGVLYNVMGYFAYLKPEYLSEEVSIFLTAASSTPGSFEAGMKIDAQRAFEIQQVSGGYQIVVSDDKATVAKPFFYGNCFVSPKKSVSEAGDILYIKKYNNNLNITLESLK